LRIFENFYYFLWFWPSVFETVVIMNRYETNCRNPMATCTCRGLSCYIHEGCTSDGRQVARATKFHTVAPNISTSTITNLLYFILLAPRSWKSILNF